MPCADRLAAIIPVLVDVGGIVEAVDADAELILSAGNYGPRAVRVAGADDLVVVGWEHAGTVPRRWDVGGALASWTVACPLRVNREAVKALTAGYVESAVPQPRDLRSSAQRVTAHLNWTGSRINLVFENDADTGWREVAARAVPALLADPRHDSPSR
ncbi:MAG: hypothetical protein LC749_12285 [Actinobacteria bacterium]|nr:hypothetical protein [Actinomycetota bacterium]